MKQILRQELVREIKYSFMRFLSIAALIALGTSFFIGLKSAAPNMFAAGNDYFAEHASYDARLISADGITEEQAKEIGELAEVEAVAQKRVIHQIMEPHGLAVEVDTYEAGQYEIVKGRAPQSDREILLDAKVQQQFKLGDRVTFETATSDEQQIFQQADFEVVGFANSYRFLSKNTRGITTIGNGELNCFGAVISSAFAFEGYNALDIHLTNERQVLDHFGDRYLTKLSEAEASVRQARDQQQEKMEQSFEEELSESETKLQEQIETAKAGLSQLEEQIMQLSEASQQLPEGIQALPIGVDDSSAASLEQLTNEQSSAAEGLNEMEKELTSLKDVRDAYRKPTYELQGIDQTITFNSFKEGIQSLDALGNTLPIVFYFVACLITVSIITRMIDQERKQIGTLKALGVKSTVIIRKYSTYSLLSGGVGLLLGILSGSFVFSKLLIGLYSPMYILKEYKLIVYWPLLWIAGVASLLSIAVIPFFFYRKTLASPALHLMRAKPPIKGRKIFLEHIPILWNRCSFSMKMGLRNLFRYKLRMLLLFVGIAGCMVLLVVGYGARNAVSQLQEHQFGKVLNYDILTVLNTNAEEKELESYYQVMSDKKMQTLGTTQEKWKTTVSNGKEVQLTTVVPQAGSKENDLSQYIQMIDSSSRKKIKLGSEDIFITKKLAQLLELKERDQIEIRNSENEKVKLTITHVVDNYYLHYLYIGMDIYQELFDETVAPNMELIRYASLSEQDKEEILGEQALASFTTMTQMIEKMDDMTIQLDRVIAVVIIAAAILGLVVIYNLSYINILERKQELSVIYAMGYRPIKRTFYIFREMILLVFVSVIVGYYAGLPLYRLIMNQLELEFFKFPDPIQTTIFLQAAGTLLLVFVVLLIFMHYRLKTLDVLGALKDRE